MIKSKIKQVLDDVQTSSLKNIIKKIDTYEEVTFDIFDTLIKRDVPDPTSVFSLMEFDLKESSFKKKRIKAENDARDKYGEVTLDEIYEEYPEKNQIRKEYLKQTEMEYEISLCEPNKEILPIFEYACKYKRVFLISDMYLSKNIIEKILDKAGIRGYEKLIISNEVRMNKYSGQLFDYVKKTYKCKKPLHIGNNFISDYCRANKMGYGAVKIRTNTYHLDRKYPHCLKGDFLNTFLSNAHCENNGYFYNFGFERFGPVLYGFINWLYDDLKREKIEEVYFMARDGYIMQKIYKELGYDKEISARYFEASRRSFRVPRYSKYSSLSEIMEETPLLSLASVEQILDSFGLNPIQYIDIIKKYGYDLKSTLKRDTLVADKQFNNLFNEIKNDVFDNAKVEEASLLEYLNQFDFSKKIAIVDIGWSGSIQKNLLQTLNENEISNNITGYYMGLSKESVFKLGKNGYQAKAYLFDCLNNNDDHDIEISFRPLFETLFLEQNGSIMRYEKINGEIIARRYDYEYLKDGILLPEAIKVKEIQQGALAFVRNYQSSKICNYIGNNREIFFRYIYETGTNPDLIDLDMFGDFLFFNNGAEAYLAQVKKNSCYLFNPKNYVKDLASAQWKIGFLKRTLKIKLPYLKIYMFLHRVMNHTED